MMQDQTKKSMFFCNFVAFEILTDYIVQQCCKRYKYNHESRGIKANAITGPKSS